ncbi:hypothetical protein ABN056_04265 [Providencia vermicola]|uniref:hypothetical protein n=1 Tax=Providencia TaxID=586 RepID=UPI002349F39B|nr:MULTISPECIES: hypothetical protein [Providencia]ELR5143069.1 hypothetical protein [Providencia stuartii]WER21115.1 hypothetical protein P2E04_13515 [Providencia stuartii]WER25235.1 hypothetical protein P2E05_13520 [Providencia stuartii]WER29325.1 hypothetical protein P2E06_13520 [Providencia stuartii]
MPGKLQSMMDNGWQHFLDEMKSLPEDIATDMVGDVIKNGDWQEALSNPITKLTNPKEWRNLLVEKGAPSLFFALVEAFNCVY